MPDLPTENRERVRVDPNEFIDSSTVNRGPLRLLENDLEIKSWIENIELPNFTNGLKGNIEAIGDWTVEADLDFLNANLSVVGGASQLNDLTDVVLTPPVSGEIIQFDGSFWVNVPGGGTAPHSLFSHNDVDTDASANIAIGEALVFDGTKFTNSPLTGAIADYILIRDVKLSGTNGGSSLAGSYLKRDLTEITEDNGSHASLSASQITLDPGTYRTYITCPATEALQHKARLQNVSDATTVILGTVERISFAGGQWQTRSVIAGRFTIISSKTFEVQHRVTNTRTDGFGSAAGFGDDEIYTVAEFFKEA